MFERILSALLLSIFIFGSQTAIAEPLLANPSPLPRRDPCLDEMMGEIAKDLLKKYSRTHNERNVSAAIIDLGWKDKPWLSPAIGSFRGDEIVYPASVVKVFYMAAAYVWAQAGKLKITSKCKYDIGIMIRVSSNTATQRTLNRLCDVDPGDRLSEKDFKVFSEKRGRVNEWLRGLGFQKTNACQGTWDGEPSARDMQLMTGNLSGKGPTVNHNKTTAEEVARFFWLIASDRIARPEDCAEMRELMERKAGTRSRSGSRRLFQDRLPSGTTIWSKSGFTSNTSHDSGIITTKEGRRFILVVLTEVYYDRSGFIGDFAVETVKRLKILDAKKKRQK